MKNAMIKYDKLKIIDPTAAANNPKVKYKSVFLSDLLTGIRNVPNGIIIPNAKRAIVPAESNDVTK